MWMQRGRTAVRQVRGLTDDFRERWRVQIQLRHRQLNTETQTESVKHTFFKWMNRVRLYSSSAVTWLIMSPVQVISPASCSHSATGCVWGWWELAARRAPPAPTKTTDWMTGPGSEARTPNRGNNRLPVRRADRKQETGTNTNYNYFTYYYVYIILPVSCVDMAIKYYMDQFWVDITKVVRTSWWQKHSRHRRETQFNVEVDDLLTS